MTTNLLSSTGPRGHMRLRLDRPTAPPAPHPFFEWLVRPVGVEGAAGQRYGWPVEADEFHYVIVVERDECHLRGWPAPARVRAWRGCCGRGMGPVGGSAVSGKTPVGRYVRLSSGARVVVIYTDDGFFVPNTGNLTHADHAALRLMAAARAERHTWQRDFDVSTSEGMLSYLEALDGAESEDEVDRLVGRLPVEAKPATGLRAWEPSRAAWAALAALHVFAIMACLVGLPAAALAGGHALVATVAVLAVVNVLMLPSAIRNAVR